MTEPASTITQSHFGLPSGGGFLCPSLFNCFDTSLAVASACLVERHVDITKKSATEDFFLKSITLISSALASSRMLKILSLNEDEELISFPQLISLISNFS